MKKAVIILANIEKINKDLLKDAYVIGADKGAYNAMKQNIKLDIAIGDFDSISEDKYNELKNYCKIIKLNPIKDKTDTEEAIDLVADYDEIRILGGIQGKRIDHFYAILTYLRMYPNLIIEDDYTLIETKSSSFTPKMGYKYMSLFSIADKSIISIEGCKYNLDNYIMTNLDPLGQSNEVLDSNAKVSINEGRLIVIYTKDDHIML